MLLSDSPLSQSFQVLIPCDKVLSDSLHEIPYMGVGHSKRPLSTQYLFENGSWAFKAPALNPVFLKMGVGIQSACFESGIFLKVAAGNHMQMLVGQL